MQDGPGGDHGRWNWSDFDQSEPFGVSGPVVESLSDGTGRSSDSSHRPDANMHGDIFAGTRNDRRNDPCNAGTEASKSQPTVPRTNQCRKPDGGGLQRFSPRTFDGRTAGSAWRFPLTNLTAGSPGCGFEPTGSTQPEEVLSSRVAPGEPPVPLATGRPQRQLERHRRHHGRVKALAGDTRRFRPSRFPDTLFP